ncbi:hypothetical protein C0993_007341 [Termitomyces sp. T159_Od127]|nr:hypothetical protein C0993_007341 [Termitomyces sp. T159_Od127]
MAISRPLVLNSDLLPHAGVRGPITDDFDFERSISLPDGITRFELPLAVRIREDVNTEESNNNGILKTVAVKITPAPRPDDMDVIQAPIFLSSLSIVVPWMLGIHLAHHIRQVIEQRELRNPFPSTYVEKE